MDNFTTAPFLIDPSGRKHNLSGENTTVGRAAECDIVVASKLVSREHAHFKREGSRVWIEDLGSTNGTFLNGELLMAPHWLRDGDSVSFGDIPYIFHDPGNSTHPIAVPQLEINTAEGVVRLDSKALEFSPKEFSLLVYLYENRGKVCSKHEISQVVWPEYPESIFDYQIENLIRRLRAKLEPNSTSSRLLLTLRGQGYKLDIG